MADESGATPGAPDASVADRERERKRRYYHERKKTDPDLLERNRQRSRERRAKFGRPKRTPEQRAKEREAERRRYAERKDDPEVIAKRREVRRERHARDPEKKRAYDRQWREAHKDDPGFLERLRANFAAHAARHPGRVNELARKRWAANPPSSERREKMRLEDRIRYLAVKDDPKFKARNRARQKEWRAKNPGVKARTNRLRLQVDVEYRLLSALRARMRRAVKAARAEKADKSINLIGCTLSHLKTHIEVRFRDGMSWANYGKVWHIDHIIPCCSFDLLDPEQQARCFHWTNLQPLLVAENLTKPRPPTRRRKK